MAEERYTFHQEGPDKYFVLPANGPNLALGLRPLKRQLARAFMEKCERPPTQQALAEAMTVIEGMCDGAPEQPLALRVASSGEHIVVDLGTRDGSCVVIGPGAWEVALRSPVAFKRTALTKALPTPIRGGSLGELRSLLNVTDHSWDLLIGWLVAAMIPEIPHPVLLLYGESGTAKTTVATFLVRLLDPARPETRGEPYDLHQWQVAAAGSWVVALDNLTHISAWLSDALCRTVTGEGVVKRRLYTDEELAVLDYRRCIILTAIDPGSLRGDLSDRLLAVELMRIPEDHRQCDGAMSARFDAARPQLLGALLDLVSRVLAELPQVHLKRAPRMADFSRILAATDRVMGTRSLAAYRGMTDDLARQVVEDDVVGRSVVQMMHMTKLWEGSASDLFAKLTTEPTPRGWPADPARLSGRLRQLAKDLSRLGITVDQKRSNRRRLICLQK
jgi:hypothetical protein